MITVKRKGTGMKIGLQIKTTATQEDIAVEKEKLNRFLRKLKSRNKLVASREDISRLFIRSSSFFEL